MPNGNVIWGSYLLSHGFSRHIIPDTCPLCYTVNGMNRRYYDAGRRGSSRTHRDGDVMQKLTDMYHDARDDREADMIRDIMSELNR